MATKNKAICTAQSVDEPTDNNADLNWYIDNILPPEKDGEYFILASARLGSEWRERAFKTKARLTKAVLALHKNHDVYVGCGRFEASVRKGAGTRGHGIVNIAVRIDLDAGKGKNGVVRDYPNKKLAASVLTAAIKKGDLPYCDIIDSGMGIHAYWRIELDGAPLELSVDAWKRAAAMLKAKLHVLGIKVDDSVTEKVSGVMRLPGTLNNKPEQYRHTDTTPQPVRVLFRGKPVPLSVFVSVMGNNNIAALNTRKGVDNSALGTAEDVYQYEHDLGRLLSAIATYPLSGDESEFKVFIRAATAAYLEATESDQQAIKDAVDERCKKSAGYSKAGNETTWERFIRENKSGKSKTPPAHIYAAATRAGWKAPIIPGSVSQSSYVGRDWEGDPSDPVYDWGYSEPLDAEEILIGDYPIGAFPAIAKDAIMEYRRFGQQPLPLLGNCALSSISLACAAHADIERAAGLSGPTVLMTLCCATSGERKTSADNALGAGVTEAGRQILENRAAQLLIDKGLHDDWEADIKRLSDIRYAVKSRSHTKYNRLTGSSTNKGTTDIQWDAYAQQAQADLDDVRRKEPKVRTAAKTITSEATIEAFVRDFERGWPTGSLWNNEAGQLFGGRAMADSFTSFITTFNKFWDGGVVDNARMSGDRRVEGKRISASLMMQENVLRNLLDSDKSASRDVGFIARMLLTSPPSTQGVRLYVQMPATPALDRFNKRTEALMLMPLPVAVDDELKLEPPMLTLSPAAFDEWRYFHDSVEGELMEGGAFDDVRDVASKAADNAARIAGLFHILKYGPPQYDDQGHLQGAVVTEDTMRRGVELAGWYLTEMRRVLGLVAVHSSHAEARTLLRWLRKACAKNGFVWHSEILKKAPRSVRKKFVRDRALKLLETHNFIVTQKVGKGDQIWLRPDEIIKGGAA